MIRTLVINKENNEVNQIAAAWLQSFNKDLLVIAAGEGENSTIDAEVVKVMNDVKIQWSSNNIQKMEDCIKLNWDYIIIINHSITPRDIRFTGNVLHWINMQLNEIISNPDDSSLSNDYYINLRDSLRYQVFQTYLTSIGGKEMIGSDSCGVECDLY